jgi:hypothetical protein
VAVSEHAVVPGTADRGGTRARRLVLAAAQATAPAWLFLGVRALGLLVLSWQASVNGNRLPTVLSAWDGLWMLGIAGGGYDGVPPGLVDAFGHRTPETALAFFPGYPLAVAAVRFVTGTPTLVAAFVVSALAAAVLALGLARLGELVPGGSRWAGLLLAGLVAAAPMGVVWTMTYSEGLFCACAVWALVSVLRERWVTAGVWVALAGTTRPTAAALLLAVGGALLVAAVRRRDGWRPWLGGLIAPLGLLGYLAFVAVQVGQPSGWFGVQRRGWNSKFDAGSATVAFSRDVLASGRSVLEVGTVFVLGGALGLLVLCVRRAVRGELPWPLVVYAAGVLVMDLGSNGLMNSKARLLLPAVTLLVPVAVRLSRRKRSTALGVLVAAAACSAWFGGYALTGWQYAI